jgi:hypothetical protein
MELTKKISCFILFIAVSAPLFLSAVFLAGRLVIRHEMREKMEMEHVITIDVPANEFRWHKKNREIIINGKMFDVKSIVKDNNIYHISGLFDENESILDEELKKMNDNEEGRQKKANIILQVCLGIIADDKSGLQFQCSPPPAIIVFVSGAYHDYHSNHCLNIISPPPDACYA